MRKILTILFLLHLVSCDTMDDKMELKNSKETDAYVRMFFFNQKNIDETMVGLRKIKKRENTKIGILYSWESEFEKANEDSLCIAIFKDFKFLNDIYDQISLVKSDSLLRVGDYMYKKYTYKDLEDRDWQIKYPDDGFKKGYPIKITENK